MVSKIAFISNVPSTIFTRKQLNSITCYVSLGIISAIPKSLSYIYIISVFGIIFSILCVFLIYITQGFTNTLSLKVFSYVPLNTM